MLWSVLRYVLVDILTVAHLAVMLTRTWQITYVEVGVYYMRDPAMLVLRVGVQRLYACCV